MMITIFLQSSVPTEAKQEFLLLSTVALIQTWASTFSKSGIANTPNKLKWWIEGLRIPCFLCYTLPVSPDVGSVSRCSYHLPPAAAVCSVLCHKTLIPLFPADALQTLCRTCTASMPACVFWRLIPDLINSV